MKWRDSASAWTLAVLCQPSQCWQSVHTYVTGSETMYEPRLQGFPLTKSDLTVDGTKCPN